MSDLGRITERLRGYYNEDEIALWLHSPHPQLHGECPLYVIHDGRALEVEQILDRLDECAYL